jgi:hypothetical protein
MLSRRCELKMPSWTLYRVALACTDVSENVSSPFSSIFDIELVEFYRNCKTNIGNRQEALFLVKVLILGELNLKIFFLS